MGSNLRTGLEKKWGKSGREFLWLLVFGRYITLLITNTSLSLHLYLEANSNLNQGLCNERVFKPYSQDISIRARIKSLSGNTKAFPGLFNHFTDIVLTSFLVHYLSKNEDCKFILKKICAAWEFSLSGRKLY